MAQKPHPLPRELATSQKLLPSLIGDEGRFALIAGDDLLGVFDTYGDALTAGYKARGLDPFMVKQVAAHGTVANFTRDLFSACHTSAI